MKCNPSYKNLNEIQSYSEQRYATVQWANQVCMNDEYLKQEIEQLRYLSPPSIRERFSPISLDKSKSWGCQINPNNTVTFSSKTEEEIIIDFKDFEYIDEENSDCAFETYLNSIDGTYHMRACVPMVESSVLNTDCKNHNGGEVGSYWYVGFDKTKNYQTRPEWVDDWKESTIPAIARGQTFKIPVGADGYLESVNLRIYSEGSKYCMWGSPLYIQIWKTKTFHATKTWYDKTTKTQKRYVPDQWEYIKYPDGFPYTALATCEYRPMELEMGWLNFKFDKAVKVEAGEHYALVFMSPLSHPSHCPRIGGWARTQNQKYKDGDAFLSEDNGRHWKRYGKNDENWQKADYKLGKYTPQDYAFQFHIRQYDSGRDSTEMFYLYLKPIELNPVKSVSINIIGEGNEQSNPNILIFEASSDGKRWTEFNNDDTVVFDRDGDGEYPHIIFIRAKMKADSSQTTPYVERIHLSFDMEAPSQLYARTNMFTPKTEPMLGANVWGKVYAPFSVEPDVEGSVEIIKNETYTENFTIITAENLINYVHEENGEKYCDIDGIDADAISDNDISRVYSYLMNSPTALNILKENNIYVKPYTYEENDETITDLMSFKDGIKFVNSPAYPLLNCRLEPSSSETPIQSYKEFVDFKYDYDNDVLNFYYEEEHYVIDDIPQGTLKVQYNPIFIQDLTEKEVGRRDKGDEGLVLDYFKEIIFISQDEFENQRVKLRASAIDPIKEVYLNEGELYEGIDFEMDYINNEMIFNRTDDYNVIKTGDELSVVYTPNLDTTSICIGYHAKRKSMDKQMIIEPNYIEYKVG